MRAETRFLRKRKKKVHVEEIKKIKKSKYVALNWKQFLKEEAQDELGCSLRDATLDSVATLSTPLLQQRAQHVVSENTRVGAFSKSLAEQNFLHAGELMYLSHKS